MKYRVTISTLLLFVTASFTATAQCPSDKRQWDIAVSHGFLTGDQVADQITTNDNASASSGGKTQTYNSGATFLTIRYFVYNRLAFGITGGITDERGQTTATYTPSLILSTYKQRITTIAPELYYIYFFGKYFEGYTLVGVGPSFISNTTVTNANGTVAGGTATTSRDAFKVQYTPIGIRFGGRLGGFLELGIGYKGVVNAGLSFKLGPSCWWRG
jgi:hypothetical protein